MPVALSRVVWRGGLAGGGEVLVVGLDVMLGTKRTDEEDIAMSVLWWSQE